MTSRSASKALVTSRHNNPFATCWTRPDAVTYVPTLDTPPTALLQKLASLSWRAEIVGPHGVGKSTLLAQLEPLVTRADRVWQRVAIRPQRISADYRKVRKLQLSSRSLLVIDGLEQLSWFRQQAIRRRCLRYGAGLLVTTHSPSGLPILAKLQPDEQLGLRIFRSLTDGQATTVCDSDYRKAFNACKGNLREVFFNLYDLHERHARIASTANRRPVRAVLV